MALSKKHRLILILVLISIWFFIYTVPLKGDLKTGAFTFLQNSLFILAIQNSPMLLL